MNREFIHKTGVLVFALVLVMSLVPLGIYAGENELAPPAQNEEGDTLTPPEEVIVSPSPETDAVTAPSAATPEGQGVGEDSSKAEPDESASGTEPAVTHALTPYASSESSEDIAPLANPSEVTVTLDGFISFQTAVEAIVPALTIPNSDVTTVILVGKTAVADGWTTNDREYLKANFTGVTTLDLSNYTGKIIDYAFDGCATIASLTLPTADPLAIGSYAFQNTGITGSLVIPLGVTSIGRAAFRYCATITELDIQSSATSSLYIDDYAFRDTGITGTLTIPSSVTSIGGLAFYGCSDLTGLTLQSSDTSTLVIGAQAFQSTGLTGTLAIPSSVTSIGRSAFRGCTTLTGLDLEPHDSSSLSIGEYAFSSTGITGTLTIPSNVASLGSYAFSGCAALTALDLPATGSLSISRGAFRDTGLSGSLTIPAGVTSLGPQVFVNCTQITNAWLPANLTLNSGLFSGCTSLHFLLFTGGNAPSVAGQVFAGVPTVGTLYYPTGATGYELADGFGSPFLDGWRRVPSSYVAPAVTAGPDDQTVLVGDTASFSVVVVGDPAPTFQWQCSTDGGATWSDLTDGGVYSGATAEELTLTDVPLSYHGSRYRCVVSNIVLSDVVSAAATLTVNPLSPTYADPALNTFSVKGGLTQVAGVPFTITAHGHLQELVTGTVVGDTQYLPFVVEANPQAFFVKTDGIYTTTLTLPKPGSYILKVTYQLYEWDGSQWQEIPGSEDVKTAILTVNASSPLPPVEKTPPPAASPRTGDGAPLALPAVLIVTALALLAGGARLKSKRRSL